jgi:hypothetical protein
MFPIEDIPIHIWRVKMKEITCNKICKGYTRITVLAITLLALVMFVSITDAVPLSIANKVNLSDTSPNSPAIASFNGQLYIAFLSEGSSNLNIRYSTDSGKTFGNKYTSTEASFDAPVLCMHNGNLYIAWNGKDNDNLNVAQITMNGGQITGFSNKIILSDKSLNSPAIVSFNGQLYLAWKDDGNNNLNMMYSADGGKTFGNKYTSTETSSDAPVLCMHNGNLYIAWKGKDNDNLNVAQVTEVTSGKI